MALVTTFLATLLLLALGAGATLTTLTEMAIAANHRDGIQTLYAAEAGIALAVSRLRATPDWTEVTKRGDGTPFLQGRFADLVPSHAVDPRIAVTVSVSADPNGDVDVLVLQSSAGVPAGIRRNVQVTIRGRPSGETGSRTIEMLSWRER